jgi:hypothetical protein
MAASFIVDSTEPWGTQEELHTELARCVKDRGETGLRARDNPRDFH